MVALAVSQNSATRNIYIGNLPEDITEAEIREDLSKFGPIDTVKLIREKNIGFVHFLSIGIAMKVVQQLTFEDPSTSPIHSKWSERKVFTAKIDVLTFPRPNNKMRPNISALPWL